MKKNILFLTIVIIISSFYFSFKNFNNISTNVIYQYGDILEENNMEIKGIQVKRNINEINSFDFHKNFNELLIKNNLNTFKVVYGYSEELQTSTVELYVSTNDKYLSKYILLDKGNLDLVSDNVYSTNNKLRNLRIANFFDDSYISVTSIINDNDNGGMYNITSLKGDFEQNFNNFILDLKNIYPSIDYSLMYNENFIETNETKFKMIDYKEFFGNKKIKILIPIILIFLLCSKIFELTKKISVMKIEGYSSLKIYWNLFFKNFILYSTIVSSIIILLLYFYYLGNLRTFKYISICFILQFLQLFLLQIITSIIIYLIIKTIPIKTYLKGKTNLKEVFSIAFVSKVVIGFIIIPMIIPTFINIKNLYQISTRNKKVQEKLENIYFFGTQLYSNYFEDIGSDNFIALHDYLSENNELKSLSLGYYFEGSEVDFNKKIYFIDKNALFLENLVKKEEFKENEIYIFIKENSMNEEEIEFYKNHSLSYLTETTNVNIISINKKIETLNPKEILYNDYIEDSVPIFYIPDEKGLEGQIVEKTFYYKSTNDINSQKYINVIFKSFGYTPTFRIEHLKNLYNNYYNFYYNEFSKSIIILGLIIITYYLSCNLMVDTDIALNRKKYFILNVEGFIPITFIEYFIKILSPIVIGYILNLFIYHSFSINELIIFLAFFTIFELIMFLQFYLKYTKVR